MTGVPDGIADLRLIALYANRINSYAKNIIQAHSLGIRPGHHRELWSLGFQTEAMGIYLQTLPAHYLQGLAGNFAACADRMDAIETPATNVDEWRLVNTYLRSSAAAIFADPTPAIRGPVRPEPSNVESATPGIMRFEKLAAIVTNTGAEELSRAAMLVIDHCRSTRPDGVTDQHAEWLQGLANGQRSLDIAVAAGVSERTLYRRFGQLWRLLGVDGKELAIALAAEQGWVSRNN